MKTKEKQRRFDVFYPTVHGRKWIGTSNKLTNAMAIGERDGCRELSCPCGMYEIYDNKLKTDNVTDMAKDVMKSEKRREEMRKKQS